MLRLLAQRANTFERDLAIRASTDCQRRLIDAVLLHHRPIIPLRTKDGDSPSLNSVEPRCVPPIFSRFVLVSFFFSLHRGASAEFREQFRVSGTSPDLRETFSLFIGTFASLRVNCYRHRVHQLRFFDFAAVNIAVQLKTQRDWKTDDRL